MMAACLLVWGGFEFWVSRQDPGLRPALVSYTPRQILGMIKRSLTSNAQPDYGAYGRVTVPGRGASPWVLRSNIDGRPRILSLALAPGLWLSYSTESASIHQFWTGLLELSGTVFDAKLERQPLSRGQVYLRPERSIPWRLRAPGDDAWTPAEIQWIGHGFDPESGALWIRYRLTHQTGTSTTLTEWPELVRDDRERVGLRQRFELASVEGPEVAYQIDGLESERIWSGGTGASKLDLRFGDAQRAPLQLIRWFDAPRFAIEPDTRNDALAADGDAILQQHDCQTCHHADERIVGPAWAEIALRYASSPRDAITSELSAKIIQGGVGTWGAVPMPAHPEISRREARALAAQILATPVQAVQEPELSQSDLADAATYDFEIEPKLTSLHPALTAESLHSEAFTPRVGGLAFLADGRLALSTWDSDGAVYTLDGWQDDSQTTRIERIAEGLQEPLGLTAQDGRLFVIQKQEITELIDHNADGITDEYRTLNDDWTASDSFHEFGFGLVPHRGFLYGTVSICVETSGKSCFYQTKDRGKLFRVKIDSAEIEWLADGFRTPNGLGITPEHRLLVTDNQGDWLPASKLIVAEPGRFYGWRAPSEKRNLGPGTPAALLLPQNEIGNSPTQPIEKRYGRYAGDIFFGDIFNGGIKRAVLEEVEGQFQGAAFHFTAGLHGPVHRLLEAPDGTLIVGEVGSHGNWGEPGKPYYGLERVRFTDTPVFEPRSVSIQPDGFDIEFSEPIAKDFAVEAQHFALSQWYYVPTQTYGGPKFGVESLPVERVRVSEDRRHLHISVPGLKEGRVVYLHLDRDFRSEGGRSLWVNEAWYTLNRLPTNERGRRDAH